MTKEELIEWYKNINLEENIEEIYTYKITMTDIENA